MANLLGWGCSVSPGLVIEINILLLAVGGIFLIDLYNHVLWRQLKYVNMSICLMGLSQRLSLIRGVSLAVYLLTAILGIRMSKHPTVFKFAGYMIMSFLNLLFMLTIAISRYRYGRDFQYFTNMMLFDLWHRDLIEPMEAKFDCCGMHGQIDYIIENRTWSKAACCELPYCTGCQKMFHDYLQNIEMEIARDNIALFTFQIIGMLFVIIHYTSGVLVDDPYESESSEYDDEEEMPNRISVELKKLKPGYV
ncbi:uncharacterized protein LOC115762488 [Drosophila novamexicana]|uniref:uncharacterized protein LOC115762488 n=1 Tax=Drosophila novamexicana TaxID=47314 RepID=UPI0011E5FD4A|nr:uncharacterized protein LOC115762488 [Drosophila novamexicana]